ncbi:metal-dependent hydrolase [Flavicella sediminum]|uniref:metal-dependent hydrolase n=1 Tax=Flavicella sediminum TaxID=2585141 RepID=UPI00111EA48F|nr:metal-dependent hydrolase [Flavicella sediminum]
MASAFGHALTAFAIGKNFNKHILNWNFYLLGIICSILPDADVVSFSLGIPYKSFWGHRGFSHSFVFAALISLVFVWTFYKNNSNLKEKTFIGIYLFLCTASHGILDAMTSGGRGVALLAPFDNTRYFFPFRPIKVSPIGIEKFISHRGLQVLLSEFIWIGIPCLLLLTTAFFLKKRKNRHEQF